MPTPHVLINGLSIGSGGGYTVGRELLRNIALVRPDWRVTMAVIEGFALHEKLRAEPLPGNVGLVWAPPAVRGQGARGQWARGRYESGGMTDFAREQSVTAAVQLNGMIVRSLPCPTLAHCQDPWPYRPEAWTGWRAPVLAYFKRRRNAEAFRHAAVVGFTSEYLKQLLVTRLGITPKQTEVFYNGLPQALIDRSRRPSDDWSTRPLEIVSVSNVNPYKRQEMVIRALPALHKTPGLAHLHYRVIGHMTADYQRHLAAVVEELNLKAHVSLEGSVSDARVAEAYARARAFVLMSVCESFGIPAIEAMSYGTPVITADCCAMPEVCGHAAVLSPTDDAQALVRNLVDLLTHPTQAQTLRHAGYEQARQFQWADTAEKMARSIQDMTR